MHCTPRPTHAMHTATIRDLFRGPALWESDQEAGAGAQLIRSVATLLFRYQLLSTTKQHRRYIPTSHIQARISHTLEQSDVPPARAGRCEPGRGWECRRATATAAGAGDSAHYRGRSVWIQRAGQVLAYQQYPAVGPLRRVRLYLERADDLPFS